MSLSRTSLVAAGIVAAAVSASSAELITFIHDGSGTGTIGGTAFAGLFTITAVGDTNDRMDPGNGVFFIDHLSASINIDGVGTFDFITATRTFVNQSIELVGFSRAGFDGADLFNGPGHSSFASWDMTTEIGPINGGGNLIQWNVSDVMTSGGILFFDESFTDARFTAIIPAPASLAIIGVAGIAATRRRR